MALKVLDNVRMGCNWTTYIASVEGVLRGAGWWDDDMFKLMGMTGMAFHFIVHRQCCPSSVTVYPWADQHQAMMDRIGIYTDVYEGYAGMNTFALKQQAAIERIKASIDRGVAVVVWAPSPVLEFGIIYGYDDEDQVFVIDNGIAPDVDPLLYRNLGKSDVPLLFYQIFRGRVEVDPEKAYRDSLQFGLGEWKRAFSVNADYGCGHTAYDYLLSALAQGDFNAFGLSYIMIVYADAKSQLAEYLHFVAGESRDLAGLAEAARLYDQVASRFKQVSGLAPFMGPRGTDVKDVPEIARLIQEAQPLEMQAMQVIERVLA